MDEGLLSIISAGCGQLVKNSLLFNCMVYFNQICILMYFNFVQPVEFKMVIKLFRALFWPVDDL